MSAQTLKPIKLWGARPLPNVIKVAFILKELDLPSEIVPTPFAEAKSPEIIAVNPNGRLPALHDPNTGITLWESGAIVEYLIERYDTEHRLSFAPGSAEAYHAKQWLYFQVSGQAPYYGQMVWFQNYHSEKIPSAVERYIKEINRVTGVLEQHLAKQKEQHGGDGPWLVGNKISYADISFIPWQNTAAKFLDKNQLDIDQFPNVKDWLAKMKARKAISAALDEAAAA